MKNFRTEGKGMAQVEEHWSSSARPSLNSNPSTTEKRKKKDNCGKERAQ
jgi:hypothetical protein